MESSALNEEGLLCGELEKAAEEYYDSNGSEEKRQTLLQFLQTNDCREMIAKCVDGDKLSKAFVFAGLRNHLDILHDFFDQGINVDIKNRYQNTAFMLASMNGHQESVRLLLNHNSNIDCQDRDGWTALMLASVNGHKEIVQLLLDHNADIDLKNNDGKTALDLAKTDEIKEMIQNHVNTSYILK